MNLVRLWQGFSSGLLRKPSRHRTASDSVLTRSPSFSSLPRTARASSPANEPTTAGCQRFTRSWLAAPSSAPTIPRRVRLTSDKVLQLPSPPAWPDHDTLRTQSGPRLLSSPFPPKSVLRPAAQLTTSSPLPRLGQCPTLAQRSYLPSLRPDSSLRCPSPNRPSPILPYLFRPSPPPTPSSSQSLPLLAVPTRRHPHQPALLSS